MNETDLLHLFMLRAPLAVADLWRVERRNIINVQSTYGARVRNGIKGQADAFALFRGGCHVEIETKAARGILEDAQRRWRSACLANRVPHLVLRAARQESPEDTVTRWIDELRAVVENRAA